MGDFTDLLADLRIFHNSLNRSLFRASFSRCFSDRGRLVGGGAVFSGIYPRIYTSDPEYLGTGWGVRDQEEPTIREEGGFSR